MKLAFILLAPILWGQPSMPSSKPTCAEQRQRLADFQIKERSEVRGMKEGEIRETPAPCKDTKKGKSNAVRNSRRK